LRYWHFFKHNILYR